MRMRECDRLKLETIKICIIKYYIHLKNRIQIALLYAKIVGVSNYCLHDVYVKYCHFIC
jgi:hypothetical protein